MRSTMTVQSAAIVRGAFDVQVLSRSPHRSGSRRHHSDSYDAPRGWLDRLLFWMIG